MSNQIHVSQSTANELIAQGKQAWLTAREDMIVAKGLGELQTYWVHVVNQSNRRGSAGTSSGGEDTTNGGEDTTNENDIKYLTSEEYPV